MDYSLAKVENEFNGYGFISPSSTYHRFMTGLTGGKMSSSEPSSAIFLSDSREESIKKIEKTKTGGGVSLKEQKERGGKPEECVIYELFLYHLIDDDSFLSKIYNGCVEGERSCGDCKELASQLMEGFLIDLKEKREIAKEEIGEYLD
jgi:tryptophanyl-tRNA synthetase